MMGKGYNTKIFIQQIYQNLKGLSHENSSWHIWRKKLSGTRWAWWKLSKTSFSSSFLTLSSKSSQLMTLKLQEGVHNLSLNYREDVHNLSLRLQECPQLVTELIGGFPTLGTETPGVSFSRNCNYAMRLFPHAGKLVIWCTKKSAVRSIDNSYFTTLKMIWIILAL